MPKDKTRTGKGLRWVLTWAGLIGGAVLLGRPASAAIVLDDPLQGATIGTQQGGAFVAGGWKVTGKNDCIIWHVPTLTSGAAEFDITGLNPDECRAGMQDHSEVFHMYDYAWGDSDTVYSGGYRDNPYKHFIRKTGAGYWDGSGFVDCRGNSKTDSMEILWKICPGNDSSCQANYLESDTSILTWSPAATYHFRVEWESNGSTATLRTYRDGAPIMTQTLPGTYSPAGHSIRIGASNRGDTYAGAPIDAVFSNVKIYDSQVGVPGAPTVVRPASGATINTTTAFVEWTGDPQAQFQVRVNTANHPDTGIAWDSGLVTSGQRFIWTGNLLNNVTYYVFVRLGNGGAPGPWSATGRSFTVNTVYVPPGANVVQLWGNSVVDNTGPIHGFGATYMSALRRCKYDRSRFQSDLAFLASYGVKYIRVLSMVGWYEAWAGKEIAPVSFTTRDGRPIAAWPDYWQQFRDMIDIAYDTYGIRTELTIFADAQLMPTKSARINHMQTILNNLVGREHKIMHLEVANEAWQNGFPGSQGVADLREFCQYLTDRTSLLVAISDSQGDGSVTEQLYAGSTADLATEHFSRDIGTVEGGWLPVRSTWDFEFLNGVPTGSNNEPIGPGSSVAQERDPIKLVMCAAFTWGANLPLYVFHSEAGVFGNTTYESNPGFRDYIHILNIIPPDMVSWVRNDGRETSAAFTTYCNGQANKWWPEVSGATNGVVRNTGKIKGGEFLTFPIGILAGGVEIEARRPMSFQVYNPLTGAVAYNLTKNTGDRFTLAQGPGAYVIKGIFTDVVNPSSDVTIDLGSPDVSNGITHPQVGDGHTTPVTISGRSCRQNANPAAGDYYFYFSVNDAFAYQGSKPDVYIIVEYFDGGTNTITLQYDSSTGTDLDAYYRVGGSVTLTNTNTWKFKTFHLTDAWFGNRQNDGADFRLGDIGSVFYVDRVRVTTEQPLAPVIAQVTPNPELVRPNTAYTRQLLLSQGSPLPDWSAVQGPAGTQVSPIGLVSGWTPGPTEFGSFVFEVAATNSAGSATESWEVRVISWSDFDLDGDVDQSDFGFFQKCISGDGLSYPAGCDAADLQKDGDVDAADFELLRPCMNGAGQPPGC